ncbi:MAG TPA: YfcE family phosphodiesterase [Candidatus Hydrothermia bacterium]|nr:YfcE family phosphodiesterase [Candidatus Hydrothermia bacterium]
MRVLVISDIHGNIVTMEKLLKQEQYDLMICLGDIVDYGPFPNEVVQMVRENADFCVLGNHDFSLAFGTECPGTTDEFREITYNLRDFFDYELTLENANYIRNLPYTMELNLLSVEILMVHSSPKSPLDGYVTLDQDVNIIKEQMIQERHFDKILYGHTHKSGYITIENTVILNPGSLGFPRGDRHPTYGIFEDGNFEIKTLEYNAKKLINVYKDHKVPEKIIEMLFGSDR